MRRIIKKSDSMIVTQRIMIKSLKDMGFNKEQLEQYLRNNPVQVRFPRAIETEFNIKFR